MEGFKEEGVQAFPHGPDDSWRRRIWCVGQAGTGTGWGRLWTSTSKCGISTTVLHSNISPSRNSQHQEIKPPESFSRSSQPCPLILLPPCYPHIPLRPQLLGMYVPNHPVPLFPLLQKGEKAPAESSAQLVTWVLRGWPEAVPPLSGQVPTWHMLPVRPAARRLHPRSPKPEALAT